MRRGILLWLSGFVLGLVGGWIMWRGDVFAALFGFAIGLPCGVVLIISVLLGLVGGFGKVFKSRGG